MQVLLLLTALHKAGRSRGGSRSRAGGAPEQEHQSKSRAAYRHLPTPSRDGTYHRRSQHRASLRAMYHGYWAEISVRPGARLAPPNSAEPETQKWFLVNCCFCVRMRFAARALRTRAGSQGGSSLCHPATVVPLSGARGLLLYLYASNSLRFSEVVPARAATLRIPHIAQSTVV